MTDGRLEALRRWLAEVLPGAEHRLEPASADASFRRYFRLSGAGGSRIVMDAPPGRENCGSFIRIAGLLHEAGLHAPEILAADPDRGFLLLEDLGTQTYLDVLDEHNADALFGDALDALVRWQSATREGVLPPYDRALLRRELQLFPDWYLLRHLGHRPGGAETALLDDLFRLLEDSALAQPQLFVHRDYMPRNLMCSTPNPGIIDFQDAVCGAITYDVVSLFRDAFISWPEERVAGWLRHYQERARRAGLPVPEDFAELRRAFDWMGVQRHLKVIGIFARIRYRDGKPHYLEDAPRFIHYLREVGPRYCEFTPLLKLLDRLEAQGRLMDYAG